MDTVLSVLSSVFWGLLMLSVLVFLHEGGHFLAARACGVRVTEFFLGLPCRFDIHHTSRRIGTKFGVTPLLLGGYAAICGMDPTDVSCADRVLAAIYRHGRVIGGRPCRRAGAARGGCARGLCLAFGLGLHCALV